MDKDRNAGLLIRMGLYEFEGTRSRYFLTFQDEVMKSGLGGGS
jgi:hypothetical protein